MIINTVTLTDIEETLQKELEKIDQESRVARRAFENRITKHITIQVRYLSVHVHTQYIHACI